MSGKKIALILLAALSLMLPGMAYDLDEAEQDGGGAIQSEPVDTSGALSLSDLEEMRLYENSQYGFQLSYPAGWTGIEPDANDEGVVAGFLAPGEDMDNPVIYLLVQIEALPSGQEVTLDQYGQAVQTALKSNRPDLEIETEADIDIGGQPGRAIIYVLEGGEEAFRVLKAWTLSEEYAVIFTYSAPDSSYDQFAGEISQIIGSFNASTPAHEIEELDEWEDYSDKPQPISEESDPIQRLKAEKARIRELVADDAMAQTVREIRLGKRSVAKSESMTLLFSDLKGFSTMCTRLSAETVVELLNGYFDAMIPAIQRNQGDVDKFIGDAIMARFRDPEEEVRDPSPLRAMMASPMNLSTSPWLR